MRTINFVPPSIGIGNIVQYLVMAGVFVYCLWVLSSIIPSKSLLKDNNKGAVYFDNTPVTTLVETTFPSLQRIKHTTRPRRLESFPTSITPHSEPFVAESVSHRKSVVINLYTSSQVGWFTSHANDNDQYFFSTMHGSLDWFIFYLVFPENAGPSLWKSIATLGWEEVKHVDYFDRFHNLSIDRHGIRQWLTPKGKISVYTWPIVINLPEWMVHNAGVLENPQWLRCANIRWALDYALYTSVPAYQLMHHPALIAAEYEYIIRLDFDIHFSAPAPFHLIHWMQERKCLAMHSLLEHVVHTDCQHHSPQVFERYLTPHLPLSHNTTWWHDERYHFYGNFVAVKTDWFQSPENFELAKWLWNDQETAGYFRHRYTDQAVILRMLGTYYHLETSELSGNPKGSRVCDITDWRRDPIKKPIFTHQ